MSVKEMANSKVVTGELVGATPSKIDLRNAHAIRREMASVYRDMRCGNIETQDGTKLAYVLEMLRKTYETAVLEERLEEIERTIESKGRK